jgi:GntR family transcriptional regulator
MRDGIIKGRYRPFERFPSERALSETWGVSRVTMRRVLSILQEERLIFRRHGSGTFVSPNPTRLIPLMIDYAGSMRDHAPYARRRVLCWRWAPAGEWAAEMLEIAPDDLVLYSERVDTVRRVPIAYDRLYLVRSFAAALKEKHLSRVDFIETWAKVCRFRLKLCRQIVETNVPPSAVLSSLAMKPRQSVLRSTETYVAEDDRPAGVFVSYYHPAHICISSDYRWDYGGE